MWQGHSDPSRAHSTVVAPGLHGKLDLVLRHSSWRWNCPETALKMLAMLNRTAWESKGKAMFLAVCCLRPMPFGLKEMRIMLLMLTRHCEFTRLPDSPCCTNKTAISGCFSSVLFERPFSLPSFCRPCSFSLSLHCNSQKLVTFWIS